MFHLHLPHLPHLSQNQSLHLNQLRSRSLLLSLSQSRNLLSTYYRPAMPNGRFYFHC